MREVLTLYQLANPLRPAGCAVLCLLLLSCDSFGTGALGLPPTLAYLSGNGAHEVGVYTDFPDASEFAEATIYYPLDAATPIGGVAISPGFTEEQRHIDWWGPRLASHGYAVLVLDTNDPRDRPAQRAEALIAAVRTLRAENSRAESPLLGRIDESKMAVMGHSMGGGGALIAAAEYGDEIQAAIPFTPYTRDGVFDNIVVPTLMMGGSDDRVTEVAEQAWPAFLSMPESTTKVYMEIDGGDHYIADTTRGKDLALIGRYGIAWLKLYLDDDERYRDFIYGGQAELDREKFSRYVINP